MLTFDFRLVNAVRVEAVQVFWLPNADQDYRAGDEGRAAVLERCSAPLRCQRACIPHHQLLRSERGGAQTRERNWSKLADWSVGVCNLVDFIDGTDQRFGEEVRNDFRGLVIPLSYLPTVLILSGQSWFLTFKISENQDVLIFQNFSQ